MIGKMLSFGFDMATLPARLTFRGTRVMMGMPADFSEFMEELRQASDEVAREIPGDYGRGGCRNEPEGGQPESAAENSRLRS